MKTPYYKTVYDEEAIVDALYGETVDSYIPFYPLLHNQTLVPERPAEESGSWGVAIRSARRAANAVRDRYSDKTQIAIRFRMHPVFATARRAELAIRRNELDALSAGNLLKGLDDQDKPLLTNLGLNGTHFYEDLLVLSVLYNNSAALELFLHKYHVSPDKGMRAAVQTGNTHMLHMLLKQHAVPGVYLQQELLKPFPCILTLRVLLHHGADTSLKIKETGDNALSCARKAPKRLRKDMLALIRTANYKLPDSEVAALEIPQVPDQKYSIDTINETGITLLEGIYNNSDIDRYVDFLTKESSSESLGFLIEATQQFVARHDNFMWHGKGHKLLDACLFENFHVAENLHHYERLITVLKNAEHAELSDLTKVYGIIQRIGTPEATALLSEHIPTIYSSAYARLRANEPAFPQTLEARYPNVCVEYDILEIDTMGRLLRFMPTDDYHCAFDELEAFTLATRALLELEEHQDYLDDGRAKYLIYSLLTEARFDLGKRYYGTWMIDAYAELRSDDWYHLYHKPTIYALAWLVFLYTQRPEWIDELLNDVQPMFPELRSRRAAKPTTCEAKLLQYIRNAMDRLWQTKLASRRNGEIYQLEAIELLRAAGIDEIMPIMLHKSFNRMWNSIIRDYQQRYENNDAVFMDGYSAMTTHIGFRDEYDVTRRLANIIDEEFANRVSVK